MARSPPRVRPACYAPGIAARTIDPDTSGQVTGPPGPEVDISVLLITYNHAPFVGLAVQSILNQRTTRSWELIVSEDASTDATLEVVKTAAQGDPRVRYLVSETNLHSNEAVARAIRAARGRYVSMIDGDDFWIVEDKLETQASVLDAQPHVAACFSNALVVHDDAVVPTGRRWTPPTQRRTSGLAEIWQGNPFATCAGMMRRSALAELGDWYTDMRPMITDWPLYILCAEQGELMFTDEPVGAYRLHDAGLFSALSTREQLAATANFYRVVDAGLGRRHHRDAQSGAARFFVDRAQGYLQSGEGSLARLCLRYAVGLGGLGGGVSWRRWLGLAARTLR